MEQLSFTDAEHQGQRKLTRREKFLSEMEQVVPWARIESLIEPYYPSTEKHTEGGRPSYLLSSMLRVHLMQHWYGLSDPAMEDALYEISSMRRFAGLSITKSLPDESTILNFRHLLEAHQLGPKIFAEVGQYLEEKGLLLKSGTLVDATLIDAPSSTKNKSCQRDPEMHQTRKGQQYYFGMKLHIGVDDQSGLVHSVVSTAANVNDVTQAHKLLHGEEQRAFGDSGYQGVEKRPEANPKVEWNVAMKPSKRRALSNSKKDRLIADIEHLKARIRASVEHPFRVLKRQFGFTKVRYRGLEKNHHALNTLMALTNLYLARRELMI